MPTNTPNTTPQPAQPIFSSMQQYAPTPQPAQPIFSSMQQYAPAQQQQQMSYMFQQNSRVQTEQARSYNTVSMMAPALGGKGTGKGGVYNANGNDVPMMSMAQSTMSEIPDAGKCIGQVVLDWEFLHDLDLHLLKVQQPGRVGTSGGYAAEPNPEPTPEPALDLNAFIVSDASGQRLRDNVPLQSIVSYRSKVHNPFRAATPEAVLQVDRNAAVHSLKPVENLYLTETLEPGAYVVGVHNYSLRQLADNVIGPSTAHRYKTFDDFKKMDAGYQKMEKALEEQNAHAGDPDGTPEKQAIMVRVDTEMNIGSEMIRSMCNSGTGSSGVHYGITLYSYPRQWTVDAKHPQVATLEELQNMFQTGFFATADFVFDPNANTTGYNGANVVADVNSEEGKSALGDKKAAHVAILKIVKDTNSGKSTISEVIMLDGRPRSDLVEQTSSTTNLFRMQAMRQQRSVPSGFATQEPFPEPQLQQIPTQVSQMQMQQPFPEPSLQQMPTGPNLQQMQRMIPMQMSQMQMRQPFPEPSLQQMPTRPSSQQMQRVIPMQVSQMQMQQPFPEPSLQQMPTGPSLQQMSTQTSHMQMQQPFPEPSLQQMPTQPSV